MLELESWALLFIFNIMQPNLDVSEPTQVFCEVLNISITFVQALFGTSFSTQ